MKTLYEETIRTIACDETEQILRVRSYRLQIDPADLLAFLHSRGYPDVKDATFTVRVPGGGDWSHTDLELGKDAPLQVAFKQVHQS